MLVVVALVAHLRMPSSRLVKRLFFPAIVGGLIARHDVGLDSDAAGDEAVEHGLPSERIAARLRGLRFSRQL